MPTMRSPLLKLNIDSKTTSKTSSLKALLLRAWRERWSDVQWGINIKTVLPRGVSGDVYNLADCILQQALVGSGANQLVMSYLKHSLSAQLVSYAAVLQRISKFDQFYKYHCVHSLLEFLETIQVGITCRGKPEEAQLSSAVLSIAGWLLSVLHFLLSQTSGANATPNVDNTELANRASKLLSDMLNSSFLFAMICLSKYNDPDLFGEVVKRCSEVSQALQSSTLKPANDLEAMLARLQNLELPQPSEPAENTGNCVQALLAIEVAHRPSTSTSVLASQLLLLRRLKGYSMPRLYSEVIRACLLSLNDVVGMPLASQWGAFTFIKLPRVLQRLNQLDQSEKSSEYSQSVFEAVDDLVRHFGPLLDVMDAKCACNCLDCLLHELVQAGLLSEKMSKQLNGRREPAPKLENVSAPAQNASLPKVIIRAVPTLAGILKTLNTDKIQEALLGMLYQVLTGKSFELILSVATVEGKLRTFASRLIRFNESASKQTTDVSSKAANTRAMLFDLSFLMLCSIVQAYGSEAVLDEGGDSFFELWVRNCMVEKGKPKCPDRILKLCDPAKVDALLQQLKSSDGDPFKGTQPRWHEVCLNVPGVMRELLVAWECEVLTATDVKRLLDALRQKMCCLSLTATAWLCAHMQTAPQDALLKPRNMVQQLVAPVNADAGAQEGSGEEAPPQDNYRERWELTCDIVHRMQHEVRPPAASRGALVGKQPAAEPLLSAWRSALRTGWLDHEAVAAFRGLLHTAGPTWFVLNLVDELRHLRQRDDLHKAVDLALGIFHLDIERCSLAMLRRAVPACLSAPLIEPQSTALAKLAVYALFALLEQNLSHAPSSGKRKRPSERDEPEPASKLLRMDEAPFQALGKASQPPERPAGGRQLQEALKNLFITFHGLSSAQGHVSQQTHFIFVFLRLVVACGKDRAGLVLQALPQGLIPHLVRALPEAFTCDLILRLYDVTTANGRSSIARDLCLLRNHALRLANESY